ncbi:MAG: gas vesicle protein [Bacillota bacterium]
MEPIRDQSITLVDFLDRILDKGLVLDLDMIICVAEVPLIGINLKAAIAGIETMIRYGMMDSWDTETREQVRRTLQRK